MFVQQLEQRFPSDLSRRSLRNVGRCQASLQLLLIFYAPMIPFGFIIDGYVTLIFRSFSI